MDRFISKELFSICPYCGVEVKITPVFKLPTGYDDSNNPVSMYEPDQVGFWDLNVEWDEVHQCGT